MTTNRNTVRVEILNTSKNPNPEYKTAGAAGFDIAASQNISVFPGSAVLVPTGLFMKIPEGYEGQLRLRSSMYKKGIVMPNAPGTIDSDYRGEIFIAVRNPLSYETILIEKGERIAQMVINEVPKVELEFVTKTYFDNNLKSETERAGGFGSTGTGLEPE